MTHRVQWLGSRRLVLLAIVLVGVSAATLRGVFAEGREADGEDGYFGFTTPIACKEVKGYEDFEVLPGAALTCDEKLVVYFKPLHYKALRRKDKYEVSFSQDCRIRRRGEKAVIWGKKDILKYKVATPMPPQLIYLTNKLALKALKPGDYDYDIILRDDIGKSGAAVRTLPFTIIAAATAETSANKNTEPGTP